MTIKAAEYPLTKIFSNEFIFKIPNYQRPYAWTTEQAEELLDDFVAALGDGNEPIAEINPYFLGSIVLIKGDNQPDADVVDGQQRLTTLTILLSALRVSVSDAELANALTKFLCQPSDILTGTPTRYRLALRPQDEEFFKNHIQDESGIKSLNDIPSARISDSQRNIKDNALKLLSRLGEKSEAELTRLAQFIATQCFLVVVSTSDADSAYRIFSVMNDRGLDLSPTDILKADIIGKILELQQQKSYTVKWEGIEEKLGRERFKDLFSHIRMIYRKAKLAGTVIKEFREYVIKTENPKDFNPQVFIDQVLCPFADAFYEIQASAYRSDSHAGKVNSLFKWLNLIDNSDWLPPAILYLSENCNHPDELVRFFTKLERLAAGLMIQRYSVNQRIERYSRLLVAIEAGDDLFAPDSPLQLTDTERNNVVQKLDGDLYLIRKIRLYVLLRLNDALAAGAVNHNCSTVTIEHVLPQTVAANSEWMSWFPTEEERQSYVHRLGNLVLLTGSKNPEAQNYDFAVKKDKYFKMRVGNNPELGVSAFVLTTQVLNEQEWTSEVIERRQESLINYLKQVWNL